MRGSSVHFKRISSAIHAVSHASREVPPEYLLPEGMSLGTHVVIDDHGEVQKMLEHKMHLASRQAKATKDYSPLWEGVINLPAPSAYVAPAQQIEIVRQWCKEYEKMTGHKVLRADVHLDEGYIDATGHPQYNAHAHVMCDRTDDKGKVKKLTSTVLREVQSMTAKVTTLQRGLDAKTTGRKHINHHNFRFDAEKNRLDLDKPKADLARQRKLSKEWSDKDLAKVTALEEKLAETQSKSTQQAQEIAQLKAQLNEQYRLDREALKATGTAKQADYQALKKAHEATLAVAAKVPQLEATVAALTQENQTLKAELEAAKARLAANPSAIPIQQTRAAVAPSAPKTHKTPQEAPKSQTLPTPLPEPEKPLLERLEASYRAFLAWIKGQGGVQESVGPATRHYGPVVRLDDLHAVQSTGRGRFAVHQLDRLDKLPALDDPRMEIRYLDGNGTVTGKEAGKGIGR